MTSATCREGGGWKEAQLVWVEKVKPNTGGYDGTGDVGGGGVGARREMSLELKPENADTCPIERRPCPRWNLDVFICDGELLTFW